MKNYFEFNKTTTSFSIYYYIHHFFKRIEFAFFILLSLIFIIISQINPKITNNISSFFIDVSVPIVKAGSSPFNIAIDLVVNLQDLINARNHNEILIAENEKLQSLYIKAININEENKELRNILNFIGLRTIKYKTARLIARSHQLYNRSILIDGGLKDGLKEDSVVLGKNSVIGRLIEVNEDKSRVLLISDVNSKVPVITSNSRQKGILAGDESDVMKILYLKKNHTIKVGDMVFTSGDGEAFPPGLLVGIVTKVNNKDVEVRAIEDVLSINIVTIVEY